ncbi:MAG: homoserine dehydrogenase [Candidatus Caenarcaniphilales bacterium]|nr:homoserine dehydrogenase [Candidatus Caenarcaniphilales bacterium]
MLRQIALLGAGTIGACVAVELLEGRVPEASLKKILVKDLSKKRPIPSSLITDQIEQIISDPEIGIVIELIGGVDPAFDYLGACLRAGKAVITANKELIAKKGAILFDLADDHKTQIRLDATVGGGIPIISTLIGSLKTNQITEIIGILNGTTNYILTAMAGGKDFGEALREAQERGYAEPDPSSDISGADARYKIAIMASLAFQTEIRPDQVTCEGIERVSAVDFRFAEQLGYNIKLIGHCQRTDDHHEINASVHPTLIRSQHPLAKIDGVLNAVSLRGDLVGELLLVGPGAGPKATTSSILGDLQAVLAGDRGLSGFSYQARQNPNTMAQRYYLRLKVLDQLGVMRDLGAVLAKYQISLESLSQQITDPEKGEACLLVITHKVSDTSLYAAIEELKSLAWLKSFEAILHVLD